MARSQEAATKASAAKRNAQTTCSRGHDNWGRRKDGRRFCKTCEEDKKFYNNLGFRMH